RRPATPAPRCRATATAGRAPAPIPVPGWAASPCSAACSSSSAGSCASASGRAAPAAGRPTPAAQGNERALKRRVDTAPSTRRLARPTTGLRTMRAMTAEPAPAPLVLRRLAPGDDLAGAAALMAGYLAEVRQRLFDGYGVKLEDATPDADLLVEIAPLLVPPQALYLAEVDGRPAGTGGLKQVAPGVAEIKRMYT